LAWRLIPNRRSGTARPFDAVGFVLTGAACFGLMYGLDLISRTGESWAIAVLCLVGSVVLGVIAALHARRREHPLVDLWALRLRSYAVTIYGGSVFRTAIGSVPFLLPLLFQIGFGLDAFRSGLLVLAVFAGNLVMKPLTTPILRQFSFRATLLANGLLNTLTIFACGLLTPGTPVIVIVVLLFVSGMTRSMQFTALSTLAFADVPEERMSGANTLFNVAQQMTMGMGIALGAIALRIAGLFHADSPAVIPLGDFHLAFIIIAAISLLAILDVWGLDARDGESVRRRRPAAQASQPAEAADSAATSQS
jgi:hypothetical protein